MLRTVRILLECILVMNKVARCKQDPLYYCYTVMICLIFKWLISYCIKTTPISLVKALYLEYQFDL